MLAKLDESCAARHAAWRNVKRGVEVEAGMDQWPAQSVAIVWFTSSSTSTRADHVYEALTGQEPDSVQRNNQPSPNAPFLSIAQGTYQGFLFNVQVAVGRIDFACRPLDSSPAPLITFDGNAALDAICSAIEAKPDLKMPQAIRIAVHAHLVREMPNYEAAFKEVSKWSGLTLPFAGHSDLNVAVNRRKTISRHIKLNRLMRFAAESFRLLNVVFDSAGEQSGVPKVDKETHGCSLHIDFNTVPEGYALDVGIAAGIVREIVEEAKRVGAAHTFAALEE